MGTTQDIIILFDRTLKEYNSINYNLLLSPVNKEELRKSLDDLEISSEDFYFLYQWKNGFDPSSFDENVICQLFNFDTFMTIDAIGKAVKAAKKTNRWHPTFIPFITDFTGQYILFNNDKNSKAYGRLFLYSSSLLSVHPVCYYDSIPQMLETVIEAYKQEIYVYSPKSKELDISYSKWKELVKSMNSYSKFY